MKSALTALIWFLIAFALASPAFAQFEGAVWDTLTTDTLRDGLSQQALAGAGYQLHLTYAKIRGQGAGWSVHYRYFDAMFGWGPDRIVESSMPCFEPAIAARQTDQTNMVIAFSANDDIYGVFFHDPQGPLDVINISNSADQDMSPAITLDSNGMPQAAWITYIGEQYKIVYAYQDSDFINIRVIWESELGEFGGGAQPYIVTIGLAPHIFYRGVAGTYRIQHAWLELPDTTWHIETFYTGNSEDYTASAVVDTSNNLHLAISGNEGFGMPAHVYYMHRDYFNGQWSAPQLVTGTNSAASGSLAFTGGGETIITSCGVSGNFYNGRIYLSRNGSGPFQTTLLRTFASVTQPVITTLGGIYGALVADAPIGGEESNDIEIVYYGPQASAVVDEPPLPLNDDLIFAYPNPFNSRSTITYTLASPADISISIVNILGQRVATLVSGWQQSGTHRLIWDARTFPSGLYFAMLENGKITHAIRMVLLK